MTAIGHITTDDECRIAFRLVERSRAPVVVLSPSLGTAMGLFDRQVEALAKSHSVLCYDPRGHGASGVPFGAYSLDRLGRDVVQLLDGLAIEKAHFAGVSLGGMVGQWLGHRAPERLLSLTLANTSSYMGPPEGWAQRIAAVLESGMGAMEAAVMERWFSPGFRKEREHEVARIAAMFRSTSPAGYAASCAAIRDMDLRKTASLIDVRTLVISGERDPATPPADASFLVRNIPGATLASLDAAHLSNVERPEQFNDMLRNFLEES